MVRVEIIANQSIESDVVDEIFTIDGLARNYTIVPVAHGEGASDPRLGDAVWPEENFIFILYCADEYAAPIQKIVEQLRQHHPRDGIQMFVTPTAEY